MESLDVRRKFTVGLRVYLHGIRVAFVYEGHRVNVNVRNSNAMTGNVHLRFADLRHI